jgi:hypothetical protein
MRSKAVLLLLLFLATACAGDDSEEERRAAAEWCRVTSELEVTFDHRGRFGPGTSQITYDRAAEWIDIAPDGIRDSTQQAALILRELPTDPPRPGLAPARVRIAEYAERYCPNPVDCIADVERNPAFPCLN